MKPISDARYESIINLLDRGLSFRDIQKHLSISIATASRVKQSTRPNINRSVGRRPITFTTREKRLVVQLIISGESENAVASAKKCQEAWKKDVSADTIRSTLKEARFRSVNRKMKPRLESRHRQVRLEFVIKHKE